MSARKKNDLRGLEVRFSTLCLKRTLANARSTQYTCYFRVKARKEALIERISDNSLISKLCQVHLLVRGWSEMSTV